MSDIARALSAPKKTPPTLAEAERIAALIRPGARFELRMPQIETLLAVLRCDGALGALGVGHGKSLLAWLFGTLLRLRRVVISCPPRLVASMLSERVKFASSFYLSDAEIIPHSQLSQTDSKGLPECDLLVIDEGQAFKNVLSMRTRWVFTALAQRPETRVVIMSGTFTPRSIGDFAHLSYAALRDASPLPMEPRDVQSWESCTNPTGAPLDQDYAWTRPLLDAYPNAQGKNFREKAQAALGQHLAEARGVVLTTEQSVACGLIVRRRTAEPPYPSTLDRFPNGEPFVSEEEQERVERTYALGFWYRWEFVGATREEILEWRIARSLWAAFVRDEIKKNPEPGYFTPAHVEARHGAHALQVRWKTIEAATKVVIHTEIVSRWVGEYARQYGGLTWYYHRALASILASSGVDCPEVPPTRATSCALSIRRHGTGFNLQHWSRMLVLEPPRSGATWQQLLGRLHRQGQEAETVEVDWLRASPFAERDFDRACEDSIFIERVLRDPQKLNFASKI